jgi:hypothetical protein
VSAGPAIRHLQQLGRDTDMVGEEAKVTEVSREFTVEVLPGISEMSTSMGEGG